jgi:hypothetical protein
MAIDDLVPAWDAGTVFPWTEQNALTEDLTEVIMNWRYVNRNPIFARLGFRPVGQQEFHIIGRHWRPQQITLTAAAAPADTVFTCADVSFVLNGDTFEMLYAGGVTEQVEVVADPNLAANQITVKRADAGTAAGTIPINSSLNLIANSRTGGEKDQRGISPRVWKNVNWVQNLQHPVEVSGLLQDTANYRTRVIQEAAATPLDAFRMEALDNMVDDFERCIVYQRGISPVDTDTKRAKTKGIRQQLQDADSFISQPVNYAAYTPFDFLRDVFQGPAGVGGAPDLYFVSLDWPAGLARWKMPLIRIDMGVTNMDVNIEAFTTPATTGLFVVAPRLRPGTLIALRQEDVTLRAMRLPTWYLRGKRGDTWEGDMIARIGVQVNYPEQARFIEGISGWAPG